jgi:prolyl 4-hydroxylase
MKKIIINSQHTHFIGSWNIENNNLCKKIIDFFEERKHLQEEGTILGGKDFNKKKTTDMAIRPKDIEKLKNNCFKNYISELHKCYIDYQNQWPFLKKIIPNLNIGGFNIQRYLPGDHYSAVHTERTSISNLHRVFAWMTYLNDVEDGGTTDFSHYKISIKPETGKTLIWPAEWTHAHSAGIINTGTKYIITGWMHFPYNEGK